MPGITPTAEEVVQTRAKGLGIELLSLSEAQKELNDKLFSGWTMVDEQCPISSYPLVKDPRTGLVWSIRCQMPVEIGQATPQEQQQQQQQQQQALKQSSAKSSELVEFADSNTRSQRIAEKLVLGWELTDTICPISRLCPLMRDPVSGKEWSAALDKFISEDGIIIDSPQQNGTNQPQERETQTGQAKSSTEAFVMDDKTRNAMTKRIGEKLLAGWTMLGDVCPVSGECPLMMEPKSGRKWSAALNDFIPEENTDKVAENSPESPTTSDGFVAVEAESIEKEAKVSPVVASSKDTSQPSSYDESLDFPELKAMSHSVTDTFDQQSKRIGDRLLRGWTMLEEVCPVTKSCPLMLDPKTKRKYSAALDRFIDNRKDYKAEEQKSTKTETVGHTSLERSHENHDLGRYMDGGDVQQSNVEDQAEFLLGSWKEAAKEALKEDLEGLDDIPPAKVKPRQTFTPSLHHKRPLPRLDEEEEEDKFDNVSTRSVLSGVSHNGDTDRELERAEAAVRSKLRECRAALSSIELSMESDPLQLARCSELVQLVGTCAATLKRFK